MASRAVNLSVRLACLPFDLCVRPYCHCTAPASQLRPVSNDNRLISPLSDHRLLGFAFFEKSRRCGTNKLMQTWSINESCPPRLSPFGTNSRGCSSRLQTTLAWCPSKILVSTVKEHTKKKTPHILGKLAGHISGQITTNQ